DARALADEPADPLSFLRLMTGLSVEVRKSGPSLEMGKSESTNRRPAGTDFVVIDSVIGTRKRAATATLAALACFRANVFPFLRHSLGSKSNRSYWLRQKRLQSS